MNHKKDIFIYCAGGQGRHIQLLLNQIGKYNILGFIDEDPKKTNKLIKGKKVFQSIKEAIKVTNPKKINIALANGFPKITYKIVNKLKKYEIETNRKINFPNIIHPSVIYDLNGITFGEGNIINIGTSLTTDIKIGNFNYFNRYCILGHDTKIGSFCNFNANTILGGNTQINDFAYLGMGTRIIQGITIGKNALTGAGSIIQTNVPDNTVMIMPRARHFKNQEPIN